MVERLLNLLQRGGTITIDQLARELETSPEVVSGMIDHMARQGWLKSLVENCHVACAGCAVARECGRGEKARTWVSAEGLQRIPAAERISG
jgi:Mn-dependent DtxR family transcriptional regulator